MYHTHPNIELGAEQVYFHSQLLLARGNAPRLTGKRVRIAQKEQDYTGKPCGHTRLSSADRRSLPNRAVDIFSSDTLVAVDFCGHVSQVGFGTGRKQTESKYKRISQDADSGNQVEKRRQEHDVVWCN